MPDTKLTQLPVMTTPTTDDVMYIVDSPGGTPASMQLSAASLSKYLGPYFNARDYGAVADSYFTDGVATLSSPTFTSASANFTQADVGNVLTVMRGGGSSLQANTSIILSVESATSLTLTNNCGRSQSSAQFYINRGGDQTAAIQSAIDAATAAGGGTVFLPGVGYLISSSLVLKNRVILQGAGHGATTIRLAPASNCPMVRNDYTANKNASLIGIRDLKLLGARSRQSDLSTTLNGAYTANSNSMTLASVAGLSPCGTVHIGSVWYWYTSISGNTLTIGRGTENTVDTSQSNGATVTAPIAHGILIYRSPYNTIGTNDEWFDIHPVFDNVFVYDIKGDGFMEYGQAASFMSNCAFEYCDNVAVRPSYDGMFVNMNIGNTGRFGWVIGNSQCELSNIVTYFSGGNVTADGYGYCIEGPTDIEEGTKNLACCSAQDNKAGGFLIKNAQRVSLVSCSASSNSTSGSGLYPALTIDGCTNGFFQVNCVERQTNPTQLHAVKLLETGGIVNANLQVLVTHGAATGAGAVGSAVDTSTITGGGVNITVNGMGGITAPAFATPYTPDPYKGNIINLGLLTSALTINAPSSSHLGCELEFRLKQDGTGGRAVTWNAIFVFNPAYANTGNTLNQVYRARFRFDGTNWNLMWQSQSATAGTYWC